MFILGTGRTVVGDSWFASVQSTVKLWNINGLHSIFIVKTAHKNYPRELLRDVPLSRGGWTSATATFEGHNVLAVRFIDLQEKMFISDVSTTLEGPPRVTKHHGNVPRPMVAYEYLQNSAGIDIHNHYHTGSCGLEDAWKTKNPIHRQAAGVFGVLLTNAFLMKKYFQKSPLKHYQFKIALANDMVSYSDATRRTRQLQIDVPLDATGSDLPHLPKLLKSDRYQVRCWYCQHNPTTAPVRMVL